ncbi:mucin-5AC-like isoform X2 [Mya arenaria]|uniref:mucin-5AC-like isoform X2 n=1 Tax=Mya arenaria TaxID=6604 RepID=UPI0022E2E6C7|nr:mucin-5AC-like isoform X2 [Mya arenaria]
MASHQWVPPLPPGYEARWDPNQRAYFFINHTTKATSWVDPRFPQQAQPQNQSYQTTAQEEGKVDLLKVQELRQSFPDAPEDVISQLLKTNNNVVVKVGNKLFEMGYKRAAGVHHPPPRGNDIQERLAAMFPDADHELMTELLEACGGDEKEARETLERVGYKPVFPATHRNPSAQGARARSPAKSPTPRQTTTPTKKTSPSKTHQQSQQRARTPDKPKLTEGQKTQLMSKLQREFTSTDKTVIEMAFQVTDWDETKARSVLKDMANTNTTSRPSTSQSRPSTSNSRTRSPSPTPAVSPASLEPVAMFDDEPSRPSTSTSSHRPGSTPAYKKSSEYYSRPSTGASSYSKIGSNVSSYTSQVKSSKTGSSSSGGSSSKSRTKPAPLSTQQTKNVTELSKSVLKSTIETLNTITNNVNCCKRPVLETDIDAEDHDQSVTGDESHDQQSANDNSHRSKRPVTGQPTRRPEQYVSQYRTEARGPDPSYHVGPNKALLLTEYTRASGPNMALREGPDPSRVQGSQGAMGPDRALCCGPQHQLAMGPNRNARQPAYV